VQKDSWKKIGIEVINRAKGLTADCPTCDYWKGHTPHTKGCLTLRARALRAAERKRKKEGKP
jgi:hypothetical protein